MPHFTLQIDPVGGPVITAFVGVSVARGEALVAAGRPVPAAIAVRALVDTGATGTCVDPSILDALSIEATGSVPCLTPSTGATPHVVSQYDVSLFIPGANASHLPLQIPNIAVMGSELAPQGITALIGRDILADCIMFYNGPIGAFTLAF